MNSMPSWPVMFFMAFMADSTRMNGESQEWLPYLPWPSGDRNPPF